MVKAIQVVSNVDGACYADCCQVCCLNPSFVAAFLLVSVHGNKNPATRAGSISSLC
jgi:hypothetical protein